MLVRPERVWQRTPEALRHEIAKTSQPSSRR